MQVVREDPKNKDLLYAGTEFGLFVSLDGGKNWQKFMNNYPTVRTDDILIHPRDNDLIVATHGRSVWIADDITPLQQLTPAVRDADATLFDIRPAVAWLNDQQNNQQVGGQKVFIGENAPRGAAINYYLKSAASGDVKIIDRRRHRPRDPHARRPEDGGHQPRDVEPRARAGRRAQGGGGFGGGRGGGGAVEPGTYIVTLEVGGKKFTKPLQILQDRWLNERSEGARMVIRRFGVWSVRSCTARCWRPWDCCLAPSSRRSMIGGAAGVIATSDVSVAVRRAGRDGDDVRRSALSAGLRRLRSHGG